MPWTVRDETLTERLSAYLDGELSREDAESVRRLVATDSAVARTARELAEASLQLEQAYSDVLAQPLPDKTLDLIKNYPMGPAPAYGFAADQDASPSIDTDADEQKRWLRSVARYHRHYTLARRVHPDSTKAAHRETSDKRPDGLSRLDRPYPNLEEEGLTALGASVQTIGDEAVDQVAYLDSEGSPLATYIWTEARPASAPERIVDQDLALIAWFDGHQGHAVVGWRELESVHRLAAAFREADTVPARMKMPAETVPAVIRLERAPEPAVLTIADGTTPGLSQPPSRRPRSYAPLALAASVACLALAAALFWEGQQFGDDRSAMLSELTKAQTALHDAAVDLAAAEEAKAEAQLTVAELQDQRAVLEQQIASLDRDLRETAGQQSSQQKVLAGEIEGLETDLHTTINELIVANETIADLKREAGEATSKLAALENDSRQLTVERDQWAEQSAAHQAQMASLEAKRDALAGKLEARRQRIASLESDLNDSRGELAVLDQHKTTLLADLNELSKQSSWLAQVAGYHRGYAGTMKEVEISAKVQRDKQMLTKWFRQMLGREFSIPDLSEAGLTFIGGRVFFVNGIPTGQIAYHDAEGRLTGYCFTPAPKDADEVQRTPGRENDLNLVYWLQDDWHYVVIGWADLTTLDKASNQLQGI